MSADNDPFGLLGGPGDPFAPPPAAAPTPPAASLETPGFVPVETYNELKAQVQKLEPLAWVGEALQANPGLKETLTKALFAAGAGVGAPPSVGPVVDPAADEAALRAAVQAKMDAGDFAGAVVEAASMGATLAEKRLTTKYESAAAPFVATTAQNAIEGWYTSMRSTNALFAKIEPKVREFVAQTPPGTLARMIEQGTLHTALQAAYRMALGTAYEEGYLKNAGTAPGLRPVPPPALGGGGPVVPQADDEPDADDDKAFVQAAAARGIQINLGKNGEYTSGAAR